MENIVTVTKRARWLRQAINPRLRGESYEVECWAHVSGQTYRWYKHFNPDRETLAQMLEDFARYIRISARVTDEDVRKATGPLKDNWRERASQLELDVKKEKDRAELAEKKLRESEDTREERDSLESELRDAQEQIKQWTEIINGVVNKLSYG